VPARIEMQAHHAKRGKGRHHHARLDGDVPLPAERQLDCARVVERERRQNGVASVFACLGGKRTAVAHRWHVERVQPEPLGQRADIPLRPSGSDGSRRPHPIRVVRRHLGAGANGFLQQQHDAERGAHPRQRTERRKESLHITVAHVHVPRCYDQRRESGRW